MSKRKSAATARAGIPPDASFIFRGTVVAPRASKMPDIKADARTLVVRVDEVIAGPPAVARTAGREITVVGATPGMKAGDQAEFHAASVSFGEEVAVRAMRVEPLPFAARTRGFTAARAAAAPLPAVGSTAVDPVQAHRDLLLKRSLDNADVVVTGTVTEVRVAPEAQARATPRASAVATSRGSASRRSLAAAARRRTPISEHDPIWQEAVVNVESVEKGTTAQQQVVVRFPGSNDVRWRNYPKLRPGQQGVFLLNKGAEGEVAATEARTRRGAGAAARMTAAPLPTTQSMSIQAMSEHPISAIERVRQLLDQPVATARTSGGRHRSRRSTRARKAGRTRAARRK